MIRRWWRRVTHHCDPLATGTRIADDCSIRFTCGECGETWVYETRTIEVEIAPAVWDRWAETGSVRRTGWWPVKR